VFLRKTSQRLKNPSFLAKNPNKNFVFFDKRPLSPRKGLILVPIVLSSSTNNLVEQADSAEKILIMKKLSPKVFTLRLDIGIIM
jgi:hypothetical protein